MSTLVFALLIACIVATVTFYVAGSLYGFGSPWARDICSLSRDLCQHPQWAALATGAVAMFYLMLRMTRF